MPVIPLIGRRCNRVTEDSANAELQQQNHTNLWKEIERTVRRVDEDKVRDCTEDIDALLVFAGLYSAVLTAFLIESYKNLQADSTQDYLRQIALQTSSYNFNNGYLNATFSASQSPPFQAGKSDIRVNVCWFASLMLSLSSASFGILVKQWLREFLSISYISPQERIRIRDARIQGLETWKLFEIASLLPIFLQVSLALFFVGLCFFTEAVHSSIGTTSLFLVTCWAFFFIMSVVAPLVSPRCPYKTTSLKAAFRHARPHARSLMRRVQSFLSIAHQWVFTSRLADATRVVSHTIYQVIVWAYNIALDHLPNLHNVHEAAVAAPDSSPLPSDQELNFPDLDEHINLRTLRELSRYTEDNTPLEQDNIPNKQDRSHDTSIEEEEDTLRSAANNDLIIFRNIDASFFDDTLLSVMQQALQRRPHPLRDTLRFVTQVFQSRLGSHISEGAVVEIGPVMKTTPWPWTLSGTARYALASILADATDSELDHGFPINWMIFSQEDSEWSVSFAFIISLLESQDPIPNSFTHLFEAINRRHTASGDLIPYNPLDVFSYQIRALTRCDSRWLMRSLLFLTRLLNTLKPEDAARSLRYIAHRTFVDSKMPWVWGTYGDLLRERHDNREDGIAPTLQIIVSLVEMTGVILHKYTLEQTQSQNEFPADISALLEFVFDAISTVRKSHPEDHFDKPLIPVPGSSSLDLYQVLTDLFTTPHTIHSLLNYFIRHPRHLLIPADTSYHTDKSFSFQNLVGYTVLSRDENIAILSTYASFFEENIAELQQAERDSLLRVLFLVYCFPTITDDDIRTCWHRMFTAAATCSKYTEQVGHDTSCQDEHKRTCNTAFVFLQKIHALNKVDNEEPDGMKIAAAVARSQVPDVMIDALRHCVCSRHAVDPETEKTFWRIKWLEELESKTASQDFPLETSRTYIGQARSDRPIVSRHSSARSDSDSSDGSVCAAVDSRPIPSTPQSNPSSLAIANVIESGAHLDDSVVGPGKADLNERGQPYMEGSVTDLTCASNIGSLDNYRLHGAENLFEGPGTEHPSLGVITAQTSSKELESALPRDPRPVGNVIADTLSGANGRFKSTNTNATGTSPCPSGANAEKVKQTETLSTFAPEVVTVDERSGVHAGVSPDDRSAPVVQSIGMQNVGGPTESEDVGAELRLSSPELSNTTGGS